MGLFSRSVDPKSGPSNLFPLEIADHALANWIKDLAGEGMLSVSEVSGDASVLSVSSENVDMDQLDALVQKIKSHAPDQRRKFIVAQVVIMLQILAIVLRKGPRTKSQPFKPLQVPVIEYSADFHDTITLKNPNPKNKFIIEMELFVDQICVDSAFNILPTSLDSAFSKSLERYGSTIILTNCMDRFEKMPEIARVVRAIMGKMGNTSHMSPKRQKPVTRRNRAADFGKSDKKTSASLSASGASKLLSDASGASHQQTADVPRQGATSKKWIKHQNELQKRSYVMNKQLKPVAKASASNADKPAKKRRPRMGRGADFLAPKRKNPNQMRDIDEDGDFVIADLTPVKRAKTVSNFSPQLLVKETPEDSNRAQDMILATSPAV